MTDATRPTVPAATFTAPPGGIMTDEAGTITGDVELTSELTDATTAVARIRYAGALDLYTVTGSAGPVEGATGLAAFQDAAAARYSKPTQPQSL